MKIGIIGSGISGIVCAQILQRNHQVTLFESEKRLGGHTHTVLIEEPDKKIPVDTGFIVFNELTYPHFLKFLAQLKVPYQSSDMSFSVKAEKTGLEYNGTSLNTIFAQRRNIFNKSFRKMLKEILRFNEEAKAYIYKNSEDKLLGEFLRVQNFSQMFIENYLHPMTAAIWSANPQELNTFPFKFLVQFFENHKMLDLHNRPEWKVVKGGSSSYLKAFEKAFKGKIKLDSPVSKVYRFHEAIKVNFNKDEEIFDKVIIAAHADQALQMLNSPTELEQEILGAFKYQKNQAILHTDKSIMPKTKRAWASWNYFLSNKLQSQACVTYHMNKLQSINAKNEYFVSLNAEDYLNPSSIIKSFTYYHPVFSQQAFDSQKRHHEISGINNISYCGAYWGYGFHEDGVNSGLAVCKEFGETL